MRAHDSTIPSVTVDAVEDRVRRLCRRHAARLPFHGWHHVSFVRAKAVAFAQHNGADRCENPEHRVEMYPSSG